MKMIKTVVSVLLSTLLITEVSALGFERMRNIDDDTNFYDKSWNKKDGDSRYSDRVRASVMVIYNFTDENLRITGTSHAPSGAGESGSGLWWWKERDIMPGRHISALGYENKSGAEAGVDQRIMLYFNKIGFIGIRTNNPYFGQNGCNITKLDGPEGWRLEDGVIEDTDELEVRRRYGDYELLCISGSGTSNETAFYITKVNKPKFSEVLDRKTPVHRNQLLISKYSSLCMDIWGGGSGNGADIRQWACDPGVSNQTFNLYSATDGDGYYIRSTQSGKCLDIRNRESGNGGRLQMWDCSGGKNQQFRLHSNAWSDGKYINAKHSNRCMSIDNNSKSGYAHIHQWDCSSNNSAQSWEMVSRSAYLNHREYHTPHYSWIDRRTSTNVQIRNQNSGLCLGAEWGSKDDSVKIHQWDCNNVPDLKFTLIPRGGDYALRLRHSNKCVNVPGSSQSNGTKVVQWPCKYGSNSLFQLKPVGNGYVEIKPSHSGKCLDVEGASRSKNAKVQQYSCNGSDAQKFKIELTN